MSRMRIEYAYGVAADELICGSSRPNFYVRRFCAIQNTILFSLLLVLCSGQSQAATSCLADTTQSDFQAGSPALVNILPDGDVTLASQTSIDQQNTSITANGFTFHSYWWVGQSFVAGVSGPLTAVDLRLFCNSCTGTTPDILVSIRATSGGSPTGDDLATAIIPGFSSATGGWKKATFAAPMQMVNGTKYVVLARAVESLSAGTYAYLISADSSAYSAGDRFTTYNDGQSFEAREYDVGFKVYSGAGYVVAGELASAVKDSNPGSGSSPVWSSLSWNGSLPANTDLKFQVAASSSPSGPFFYVGPNGSSGSFFTTSGASLSQFNGMRYLRYKALLSTTNATRTPTLHDVTVCQDATAPGADLRITKTNGVSTSTIGGQTTYTIVASNAGPSNVSSATVTDTFNSNFQNCTWTCSGSAGGSCAASGNGNINQAVNLPAGGSTTFVASCGIKSTATGSLVNTATISSALADPATGNNSATDTDSLGGSADLSISVDNDQSAVVAGSSVIYTIVAVNSGPSAVSNAVVVDTFPTQLESCEWMCDADPGGSCSSAGVGNINEAVNLAAGAGVTFTAICDVKADAAGSLANSASISSTTSDPVPGNNSDTDTDSIIQSADLGVALNLGASASERGGTVNYTIVASNAGSSTAEQATVSDQFPSELSNCSWTCQGSAGGTCPASGSGNINTKVTLPRDSHVTYAVSCTLSSSASGSVINMAEVSSGIDDPDPNNNQSMVTHNLTEEVIFKSGFD